MRKHAQVAELVDALVSNTNVFDVPVRARPWVLKSPFRFFEMGFIFTVMFYTYILQSQKDSSLYKGFTENLEKRLVEHNLGKSKYTSSRMPWKIIYKEQFSNKEEAIKREKYFKSAAGRRWIKNNILIAGSPPD